MTLCSACGEHEAVRVYGVYGPGTEPPPPMCDACLRRYFEERAVALRRTAFLPSPNWTRIREVLATAESSTADDRAIAVRAIDDWAERSGQEPPPDVRAFAERHRRRPPPFA